ncbi:MAG TPA: hypothetical protein VLC92_06530 [Rhodocyclaceae bacterium]|nr:hypothetical protein [Rhodocyclaceae bacterium]
MFDTSGITASLNSAASGVGKALNDLTSNTDKDKAPGLAAILAFNTEYLKLLSEAITNTAKTDGESTAKLASR